MTRSSPVLCFAPYGKWLVHNQVDAVVGKALELRGCPVMIVRCDGVYRDCEVTGRADRFQMDQADLCRVCAQTGDQFFKSFHLPQVQLRQYIQPEDVNQAETWVQTLDPSTYATATWQNVPIGAWVTSSINTYFRLSSAADLLRSDVQPVHRRYLADGLVTYLALHRLLEATQPNALFLFNGRFAPYRIAFEVAQARGLDVLIHERGYVDNSFAFYDNTICLDPKSALATAAAWRHTPLVQPELAQTQQYFQQREQGKGLNWQSFYNFNTDYEKVRSLLRIPPQARVAAVFTSSADELALSGTYDSVTEQIALLDRLIEVFTDRDEYLVIRHHPWIGGNAIAPPTMDFLVAAHRQAAAAPANVRIIMPGEQLTSYALMWHVDMAIAFFSTIALEAAARGIPTAVFDASPYSHALRYTLDGQRTDTASLGQLVEYLLSSSAQTTVEDLRRLYRFVNAFFFQFSVQFRAIGICDTYEEDLRFRDPTELQPGFDPMLDQVCDRLLNGTALIQGPGPDRPAQAFEVETAFLQQELAQIQTLRQQARKQSLELAENPIAVAQTETPIAVVTLQDPQAPASQTQNWLQRSRHRTIHHLQVPLNWDQFQPIFQTILTHLEHRTEPYWLLTSPYFSYDESFLSAVLDRFHEAIASTTATLKINGVRTGAWIQDQQKFIGSVFTAYSPTAEFETAITTLPALAHPLNLLALAVFRREALINLIKQLQQQPNLLQASEWLFRQFQAPEIQAVGGPAAIVHYTDPLKVVGLKLVLQHTQMQCQSLHEQLAQATTQLQQTSQLQIDRQRQITDLQAALQRAEHQIQAMESTKFWQLRRLWQRLKRMLKLSRSS